MQEIISNIPNSSDTQDIYDLIIKFNNKPIPSLEKIAEKPDTTTKSEIFVTPLGTLSSSPAINNEEKKIQFEMRKVYKSFFYNGEEFIITQEDKEVVLSHPKWSLTASGQNLVEAEISLFNKARIFLEGYSKISITELSHEALQFRNFLFSIV